MKKIFLSLILAICLVFNFTACGDTDEYYTISYSENGNSGSIKVKRGESCTLYTPEKRENYIFIGWYSGETLLSAVFTPNNDMSVVGVWERYDLLAEELKASLKSYISSEAFAASIVSAKTTQARLPLLYLKYVKGNFYNEVIVIQFKNYLNMIEDILSDGFLDDGLFDGSAAGKQGWYGIPDYLYSWSCIYNQYLQWCAESGNSDTSYSLYFDAIESYLNYVDSFYGEALYDFDGGQSKLSELNAKVTSSVNNFTSDKYRLSNETMEELLSVISLAIGKSYGFPVFLEKYKAAVDAYQSMTNEERNAAKTELKALWRACVPVTQCAFGYNIYSVLTLTAYNLGLDLETTVPNSTAFMLSYYERDDEGNFIKNGGTPNWVGFSGRPLAGSIFRNHEKYDVVFEKTMQGYFPFTDGWSQPLDEMINMDRLCNFYNHDLKTGASVAPFYGLLYGFMNGIDMEHYEKEVYHSEVCEGESCKYHIDEREGQIYNIVSMWRETLERDGDGHYIINNTSSMAVAIAYCAWVEGIEAPSPLGVYNPAESVVELI